MARFWAHQGQMNARIAESAADEVDPLLESGLARFQAGDGAAAERLFRQALSAQPDDPTALYLLGLLRFQTGDAAEAQNLIERLAALRPDHPDAQATLAVIRHWRDDRAGAIVAYRRTLELDSSRLAARVGLARALAEIGDSEEARCVAEAAVRLAPSDASARLALAAAWRGLGEVRNAVDAYAEAARLDPSLVMAHVGLALALIDAGEAGPARASADAAVRLDPNLCDAWLAFGSAMRGLHDPDAARAAFERALTIDPDRAAVHLNLGLAFMDLERPKDARRHLNRALELDPTSAKAHANLSSLYYLAGRKQLAKAHAERALAIDPAMMSAHQNLAALLAEEQRADEARAHRDLAYAERNLLITTAAEPRARVLILSTTESGNTPDRFLIPPASFTRLLWFIEYAAEAQMRTLPDYDIAFNAIGDEDLAAPTAPNAARFSELCRTRLLNPPEKIARTRRDLVGELFGALEGVKIPRTVRLDAASMAAGAHAAAAAAGLGDAFLIRPIGSHGGKGLQRASVDAPSEPAAPALAYYLTAFEDFRSADGFYRKYRAIFVGGRTLPYHLAISPDWLVHYESAGMQGEPDRLAEEMRFLADPAAAIGKDAWNAVQAIGETMDLDYAGVDYSVLPDGRVLLFEANATMLVHPEAEEGPLAHKNPFIARILDAFADMLTSAA
jgi:tetratricopeptide (TPR) repeat protein/glutathione synthase/RimK-type ligase-like ATP-grasp enzyme